MKNLKEYVLDWFAQGTVDSGKVEAASYGDEVVMVKLEDACIRLGRNIPDGLHHVGMLMTGGELRLTLNGDRMGFLAPLYIDFIDSNQWDDVVMEGHFEGYLLVVDRNFFLEANSRLRSKISEKMMVYTQYPFVQLGPEESNSLERLSTTLFVSMSAGSDVFRREMVQSILCACLCELWNIVFRRGREREGIEENFRWGEFVSHFLYLAHTYCRDRHEVGWYCEQLGVSANALNASLKRLYGKTARNIIDELLLTEAQVALRNPEYSVQNVSDMLNFSDQSSFGKFFKRCCGVSPALFRRELEKGQIG